MSANRIILFAAAALLLLPGCSSAPKRPAEIFSARNAASGQLDLGNASVSKGDYTNAHLFLQEAWRLSISTDDPAMRIKVRIAEGNAWFNEGNKDKAASSWEAALKEAEEIKNAALISLSKIYRARGTLVEGSAESGLSVAERQKRAQDVKVITETEMKNVAGTPLYAAFAWKVLGLAEKELGKWDKAEEAIKKAADLHEKGRYLEDTAYDWYLIASVRSKASRYSSAKEALQTALSFDRRAENANGLGMDWLALGIIEEKAGNITGAAAAYSRSSEIFKSVFLVENAAEADKRLSELKQ